MMVSEHVPVAIRGLAVFFSVVAASIANPGRAKSCSYGTETYDSTSQINFLVATSVLVILCLTARIAVFDVKKHRLPPLPALLAFEGVFLVFTFAAAVAVALSPVGSSVCTGGNELKEIVQEACDISCSRVLGAVATTFLTFVCFLLSGLFTAGVIETTSAAAAAARAAADLSFADSGTPRTRKPQAKHQQSAADAALGRV
ncbi:hypothetical protein PybrP1_001233 [[Pythium] brassicae (nom. inval.)]|nr:hypothetical protein PybrP1_001233 [[Pythium] brassicae (nom. inval.)]